MSLIICAIGAVVFAPLRLPAQVAPAKKPGILDYQKSPQALVEQGRAVWSLALSADGRWAVSGDDVGRVFLRDTLQNTLKYQITAHQGIVSRLAFAPQGDRFASAGFDGKIHIWDRESGQKLRDVAGHGNWVTSLALSPNGRFLISAGYDRKVKLWDTKTGHLIQVWPTKTGTARSLAFFPDGERFVIASDDGRVDICETANAKPKPLLSAKKTGLVMVGLSQDGKRLLTVPQVGVPEIWDVATKKSLRKLTTNEGPKQYTTGVFSSDGKAVLAGTINGQVKYWSANTGRLIQTLGGHRDTVMGLAISRDRKTLVTGGLDGQIHAWPARLPLEPPLHRLPILAGKVWAMAMSPTGNTVAVGGQGGFVELWDLATGQQMRSFPGLDSTVDCLEFSQDGVLIAAAGWGGESILVWNANTGEETARIALADEDRVRAIALSPDGRLLAVGFKNQKLRVYPLDHPEKPLSYDGHNLPVYDVAFSPDGETLASCSGEWTERKPGRVLVHDVQARQTLMTFNNHTHAVRSVDFSADGGWLCSLSQDGVVVMYDLETHQEVKSFRNGLSTRPVSFSPDSRLIACGLQNGNINIWDVERKSMHRRLEGTDDLFAVVFSRDGSVMMAADGNPSIPIWQLSKKRKSLAARMTGWLHAPAMAQRPEETP